MSEALSLTPEKIREAKRILARERRRVQDELVWQCRVRGLPPCDQDAKPFPRRRLEIDLLFPSERLCVEVQGGIWRKGGGAHSRPANIERDIEKAQLALLGGWRLLPVTTDQVRSGEAVDLIIRVIALVRNQPSL